MLLLPDSTMRRFHRASSAFRGKCADLGFRRPNPEPADFRLSSSVHWLLESSAVGRWSIDLRLLTFDYLVSAPDLRLGQRGPRRRLLRFPPLGGPLQPTRLLTLTRKRLPGGVSVQRTPQKKV